MGSNPVDVTKYKTAELSKNIFEISGIYIVAYWKWFSPKSCLTKYVSRASCLKTVAD